MTQILALQGLESELGAGYITPTGFTSHLSSSAHIRFEQPVEAEEGR